MYRLPHRHAKRTQADFDICHVTFCSVPNRKNSFEKKAYLRAEKSLTLTLQFHDSQNKNSASSTTFLIPSSSRMELCSNFPDFGLYAAATPGFII